MQRARPRAGMQARAVAIRQQRVTETARVVDQPRIPRVARPRQRPIVTLEHDRLGHRVEQFGLVPEMPVKRRRLHAEPFGELPCRQPVYPDFVEQFERRAQYRVARQPRPCVLHLYHR